MMNKLAIYYITVGNNAKKCLELSYKSLIKSGFKEDIYIISDNNKFDFKLNEKTYVKVIDKTEMNLDLDSTEELSIFDVRKLDMKNPRNKKMYDKFTICHMKSLVELYVPVKKYDRILYLDSDIIVSTDFADIKEYLFSNSETIMTATNRTKYLGEWPLFISPLWFKKGTLTANLNKWELFKNWHNTPLCADVISFPVNQLGFDFLSVWKNECKKGIDSDQAALQAVLLRSFRRSHTLVPYEIFGYGPSANAYAKDNVLKKINSKLIHFHGAVYDNSAMRDYYHKYEEN